MADDSPRPQPKSIWTDEKVTLLLRLWDEGLSARRCAEKLGPEFSRNAVIAKLHRLKIPARPQDVRHLPKEPRAPRRPKPYRDVMPAPSLPPTPTMPGRRTVRLEAPTAMPKSTRPWQPHQKRDVGPPIARLDGTIEPRPEDCIELVELRAEQCRYPVVQTARAVFCFCGQPTVAGRSWCQFHYRVCFVPFGQRRERSA